MTHRVGTILPPPGEHFPRLFRLYHHLYSENYDFFYHLEDLVCTLGRMWFARPRICGRWMPGEKQIRSGSSLRPCWAACVT